MVEVVVIAAAVVVAVRGCHWWGRPRSDAELLRRMGRVDIRNRL